MKNVYFILKDAINDNPAWDTFGGLFPDLESATAEADWMWRHLTTREQRKCIITVNHITAEDDADPMEAYEAAMESGGGWYEDFEFRM